MTWQPIETAPQEWAKAHGKFLIGHWYQPVDEDGEPDGEGEWSWVQVAYLSYDGWHVWSSGFAGVHGTASFRLVDNATHWAPLPDGPPASAASPAAPIPASDVVEADVAGQGGGD